MSPLTDPVDLPTCDHGPAWWERLPGALIVFAVTASVFGYTAGVAVPEAMIAAAVATGLAAKGMVEAIARALDDAANEALEGARILAGPRPYDQDALTPLDVEADYPGETLASCICGRHYACPDGWHQRAEWPCSCTADCALNQEEADL